MTATVRRPMSTEDGQPWGSTAYDSDAAVAMPALISRHLSSVQEMRSVRRAWTLAYHAMRLEPGDRALDVGCGTGHFLPVLGESVGAGGRVVGLDHARLLLDEARQTYSASEAPAPLELIDGDAHALPFGEASFDSAHTERVLMHLTNPDLALRELARVVRPGGTVVCVEPDLAGWRIDFPDQEAIRALISGFCASWRFPAMGLELPRRMGIAGLVDLSVEVVTEVERSLPDDVVAYYRRALAVAVERALIDADRGERLIDELAALAANGEFTSSSSLYVVGGRVPDR